MQPTPKAVHKSIIRDGAGRALFVLHHNDNYYRHLRWRISPVGDRVSVFNNTVFRTSERNAFAYMLNTLRKSVYALRSYDG